jgi:hypothetical protein
MTRPLNLLHESMRGYLQECVSSEFTPGDFSAAAPGFGVGVNPGDMGVGMIL